MKISVIVSTYNSPEWLEKVLTGYACQSDKDFEIVVADDGSGPDTKKLIEDFGGTVPYPLRHVWHEDEGFRKWRIVNKAMEAAQGEYLILTDGDCIPRTELVATHRKRAGKGRFLSGGYCKLPMEASKAITPDDIRSGRAFQLGWLSRQGYGASLKWLKVAARPWHIDGLLNAVTPAKKTFNGNNSSCWRADALRIGGFDERIRYGGGDREFGYRLVNAGITPIVIRYSALCLHLDHARGYKDPEIRERNEAIIAETLSSGRTRTEFGIIAA
ncbi:MAG: glycosyltransferase family 2 protein [Salaquimonas sp.]|nr:glycosyltransferase family 2 protein [Salaquimonas sp.]